MVGERVVGGESLVEPGESLQHLLLVLDLGGVLTVVAQRGVDHRARGRPSHPEVDAARSERLELLEHLGDLERAVMVHEHGPGSQADPGGDHRGGGDEQLGVVRGTGAGQVVLGEPHAVEPGGLGVARSLQGVGQGVGLGGPRGHGPEVDDGQLHVGGSSGWTAVDLDGSR